MAPSAPERCRVFASVLYWQRHELQMLERCVESLLAQRLDNVDLVIVVVDNGCGATPTLPDDHRVRLVRLRRNRGFTGGHNFGIRYSLSHGADFVFLVNSDLVADVTCVQQLVDVARQSPNAAACGPLVLRESQPEVVESAGQSFNRLTGRHHELGRGLASTAIDTRAQPVDAISGCAMLIRASTVRRIGALAEALFIYFEDMDWCLRAGNAGLDILVVPGARVWHRGGGSTGPSSPFTTFYSVRNHAIVARRFSRLGNAAVLLVLVYHLAFLVAARERRSWVHLEAALRGVMAALTGALGPQPVRASSD